MNSSGFSMGIRKKKQNFNMKQELQKVRKIPIVYFESPYFMLIICIIIKIMY